MEIFILGFYLKQRTVLGRIFLDTFEMFLVEVTRETITVKKMPSQIELVVT